MIIGTLYEIINKCQQGEEKYLYQIIDKFKPIIKSFANKLKSNDAENELSYFVMELIYKIKLNGFEKEQSEGALINYIVQSVRHEYIRKSKRQVLDSAHLSLNDAIISTQDRCISLEEKYELHDILSCLTNHQREVIRLFYFQGLSDQVIGQMLHTTRQAVNRTRNDALRKLRQIYKQ